MSEPMVACDACGARLPRFGPKTYRTGGKVWCQQCVQPLLPPPPESKEATIARLTADRELHIKMLAECFRLSGADPDGNEDWRLAGHAVDAVKHLREDYDAAGAEVEHQRGHKEEYAEMLEAAEAARDEALDVLRALVDAGKEHQSYDGFSHACDPLIAQAERILSAGLPVDGRRNDVGEQPHVPGAAEHQSPSRDALLAALRQLRDRWLDEKSQEQYQMADRFDERQDGANAHTCRGRGRIYRECAADLSALLASVETPHEQEEKSS
jgi:hypothetical protein